MTRLAKLQPFRHQADHIGQERLHQSGMLDFETLERIRPQRVGHAGDFGLHGCAARPAGQELHFADGGMPCKLRTRMALPSSRLTMIPMRPSMMKCMESEGPP